MKKIILLSTLFILSGHLYAADAPFSNAPAPTQAYHDASTTAQPALQAAPPAVQPAQAVASTGAAVIAAGQDVSLAEAVSQLTQTSLAFQQQTSQRIQNLNESNQALGVAIQGINQNMAQLQQQMMQLRTANVQTPGASIMNYQWLRDHWELGGVGILILGFGIMLGRWTRRRSPVKTVRNAQPNDTKNDYDFMGSKEAIPAQLDLARSYVAMNEHEHALVVLKEVIQKGNEAQRAEAERLASTINNIKS